VSIAIYVCGVAALVYVLAVAVAFLCFMVDERCA
jgi:hypothetical protein